MALYLLTFVWMRNFAVDKDVCVCREEDMIDDDDLEHHENAYGSFSGDGEDRFSRMSSASRPKGSFSGHVRCGGSFSSANGERRISIDDARVQSMSAT